MKQQVERPDVSGQFFLVRYVGCIAAAASLAASAQDKPDPGAAELKKAMTELVGTIKDGNDAKIAELEGKVLPDAERIGRGCV
ncbi:hypothetical protein DES53_107218 [Roseimicrobium gellanilyticum]|uniref:Uncharacterized protein n=1 Tax=Roseimicrobium gellanilyticum TaxID=748857 RepID=A0A366HHI8_9BACT|nr:hypothetical protein [Roseimicrobium gellanilyticum]RBP41386.1 hypothetical protein DES53_107218 [Roseimicrobium gellanilyticum]